jgi:hypothetical protein
MGNSETLRNYLGAIGRFHRYNLRNVMLFAIAEANGYARRWLSYLAQTWAFREDRRERDFDSCSGWLGGEMSLPQLQLSGRSTPAHEAGVLSTLYLKGV